MAWNSSFLILLASLYLMNLAIAKNPCKTEVSVPGMALKGFVFKKVLVTAPHVCDITCEREAICQSYNFVIGEKSCELNTRTKEARPENFQPDDLRFYKGRISCRNIDECKGSNKVCDENANCSNTVGFYNCTCKDGFTGDGRLCSDVDECSEAHPVKMNKCHPNASCANSQGSYNCSCNLTFIGDGFDCEADPCYNYQELSDATRKSSYDTPEFEEGLCDNQLPGGWYRFVGDAGTKMPTTRVPLYRCGTRLPGWLDGAHPTVEDGKIKRRVCFSDRNHGCKYHATISVKNCGSYFIYELFPSPRCSSRYCGTD